MKQDLAELSGSTKIQSPVSHLAFSSKNLPSPERHQFHNCKISLTNSAISCSSDREDLPASTSIWVVGVGWPWEMNLSWMAWPPGSPWAQSSGGSFILQYFAPTMAAGSQVKKEGFFPFCSFPSWFLSATLPRISQLIFFFSE